MKNRDIYGLVSGLAIGVTIFFCFAASNQFPIPTGATIQTPTLVGIVTNNGSINLQSVQPPIATNMSVLLGGAGPLTGGPGDYQYRVSYITAVGETWLSDPSTQDPNGPSSQCLILTNIPTGANIPNVTGRKIYRGNKGTGDSAWQLVTTINDTTTTVYTDCLSDSSLSNNVYNTGFNTSGGLLLQDGVIAPGWFLYQDFQNNNYDKYLATNGVALFTYRNNDILYVGLATNAITAISFACASPDSNSIDARITMQFTEEYGFRFRATNWWLEQMGIGPSASRPQYKFMENLQNGNFSIGNTNGGVTLAGTNVTLQSTNAVLVGGGLTLTNGTLTVTNIAGAWVRTIWNASVSTAVETGSQGWFYPNGARTGLGNGPTNSMLLLPTTGYLSNFTFCFVPGFQSTTNMNFSFWTNSGVSGVWGIAGGINLTLLGTNGASLLSCTNSGTLSYICPSFPTFGAISNIVSGNSLPAGGAIVGTIEWWHQTP